MHLRQYRKPLLMVGSDKHPEKFRQVKLFEFLPEEDAQKHMDEEWTNAAERRANEEADFHSRRLMYPKFKRKSRVFVKP